MPIRFGDFELDEQRFQLRLAGRLLAIRPKVFDLLVLLIRSRERVVVRDELVLAIWGTTAVGSGSLSGLVNELRQVLGEDGRATSSIRTVHARGYQFVAIVESSEATASTNHVPASDASEDGPRQLSGPALELIRASFEAARCFGPRASLVPGAAETERADLHDWATHSLRAAGFEIIRAAPTVETDGSVVAFVDRLLEALVERYGLSSLRLMVPARSGELFERCSKRPIEWSLDALAAQQYEGRIRRGAAELLKALAIERPIAFLFDAAGLAAEDVASSLSPLLRLLEGSPVFILCMTRACQRMDESERTSASAGSDSKIDWIAGLETNHWDQPLEDHDRLNAFLAACGIDALPRALADALIAHVRADENTLESLAIWLRGEVRLESRKLSGPALWIGSSRMRRVVHDVLAKPSSTSPR